LDVDLRAIRDRLAAMVMQCRSQLDLALEAFWSGSKEKLADVERMDVVIDDAEKAIDELLLRTLALQHPVASDLRRLTASFKVVTDLERVGDESVNIARVIAGSPPDSVRPPLTRMAELSRQILDSAARSFLDGVESLAKQVVETDETIEALYRHVRDDSVAHVSSHPNAVLSAMACIEAAKCLRRIAEHAKNIAEGALFVAGTDDEPMPR
jgi:phosphate transport system protein